MIRLEEYFTFKWYPGSVDWSLRWLYEVRNKTTQPHRISARLIRLEYLVPNRNQGLIMKVKGVHKISVLKWHNCLEFRLPEQTDRLMVRQYLYLPIICLNKSFARDILQHGCVE